MKILWVCHLGNLTAANKSLLTLIKGLNVQEVKQCVVMPEYGELIPVMENIGNVSIHVLPYRWWVNSFRTRWYKLIFLRRLIRNGIATWDLMRIIQREKPDLVITNTMVIPVGALASWLTKTPHLWYIREFGKEDHNFSYDFTEKLTYKIVGKLSIKVFTISKALERKLLKFISNAKIEVIYNGVSIPFHVKQKYVIQDFSENRPMKLLCVGRIEPGKNFEEVIHAVARVIHTGYHINLNIIGEWNNLRYYEQLVAQIANYKLTKSIFIHQYQKDLSSFYKLSDVFVIPSLNEAFGRVTIEAMQFGKCVIAANSGANPELIDHLKNGLLYKSGDENDLQEKIVFLYCNKENIKTLGNAAMRANSDFSEEKYFNNFCRSISRLI